MPETKRKVNSMPAGRPSNIEEISLDELKALMLNHAAKGGFISNLPAEIYLKTGICVSRAYIYTIKDKEFIDTMDVAKSLCSQWWTEQMSLAAAPWGAWKFIQMNVSKRADRDWETQMPVFK